MAKYDDQNNFAKILRGELPAYKVYEDDKTFAFMDIMPRSAGHALVIPKAPSRNFLDADPATLSAVMPAVQKVARAVMAATRADGMRLMQFNEATSGQTIYHLHFHIIPMYEGVPLAAHGGTGRADDADLAALLRAARAGTPKLALQTVLAQHLPRRLAQMLAEDIAFPRIIGDASDKAIAAASAAVTAWTLKPTGSEGYRTAEVTLGGVDTAGLNSTTMAARHVPGLYVIGEVVDVTGWLGGYNFQWAWASGWAAGQVA